MVDVVDSNTQQSMEMTMSQWTKYFLNPKREKILNVISLEFSHTGMDHFVEPPEVVRLYCVFLTAKLTILSLS